MSGYAHIHRTLLGHHAFRNDAEAMAFAWMVVKAAWRPTRVRYKDRIISLDRGQVAISQRDMARAMDRDKAWIERLWKRLRAEAMIEVASEAGVAVVTICNYGDYQGEQGSGKALAEAQGKAGNEAGARQAQGTEQEWNKVKNISEAKASGAGADPVKALFDLGLSVLTEAGTPEKQARSLLGKWRKGGDRDGEVLTALIECRNKGISSPVEWLTKRLVEPEYVSAQGYRYRGDEEAVMREAEKRADWTIYWRAKSNLDERRRAASYG